MRVTGLAILLALVVGACQPRGDAPDAGPDLVTLFGPISTSDRGAMRPAEEPGFAAFGLDFDRALALDFAELSAFEQITVSTDFPRGGARHVYSGPRLADVLSFAGLAGRTVRVTALDGYQREIDADRYRDHAVILALTEDGRPLGLGGRGPAMLVWPRQSDPALTDMNDDDWVFGVFAIEGLAD